MPEHVSNNKRIAKNTLMLYVRMLLMMVVSLYTSRVVLYALGVEDFGIYGVVGSIVSIFSFVNGAMSSSTQRYLTFELARGDAFTLNKVFSMAVNIHVLFAFIVLFLSETVGLWFLYSKMNIAEVRMNAAFWVYQFSILASILIILSAPYNAILIAREKMSAFAYISVFEVIAKLLVVYFLLLSDHDRLVLYSGFIFLVQFIVRCVYGIYCKRNFPESTYHKCTDKSLFKEMLVFSGWNFWGCFAGVAFTQGVNILLNIFFGPVINASRTIAVQVQVAVSQFSTNFQTALNPQITKNYAKGELEMLHSLMYRSSRMSFILLYIISLPIFLKTDFILALWLGEVPKYSSVFVRLMLCIGIIDAVANPFMIAASASGKIKKYQTVVGGFLLSIVPISYLVLKMGAGPTSVFMVHLVICICAFVVRMFVVRPLIGLSICAYVRNVLFPIFLFSIVSFILPFVYTFLTKDNLFTLVVLILICLTSTGFSGFYIALTKTERLLIKNKMSFLLMKIK